MTQYQPYPARRPSPLPLLLAGAALVMAVWLFAERTGVLRQPPAGDPRPITPRASLMDYEKTMISIFDQASPSVAHITTRSLVQIDYIHEAEQEGTGSGFVWDDRGTVVTNSHVVHGAGEVKVAFADRVFTADVLADSQDHDLAVLRLRGDVSGLRPLDVGTSGDLKVGQTVLAIGNPYGFDTSLSTGVVSALNRNIRTESSDSREGHVLSSLIQVDAAINPGNSGGPLLDSAGRLIGITTAIYSPSGASAGIGFAVPVDTINDVVPRLIAGRKLVPVLGIRNRSTRGAVQVPYDGRYRTGAVFTEVVPGMGADAAGLQPFQFDEATGTLRGVGDVILAIADTPVRSYSEIGNALRGRVAGQKVKVTLVRGLPDHPRLMNVDVELKPGDQ
jgi:S1-C subfamily serine protease